jgi:probable addiction module antidote protein
VITVKIKEFDAVIYLDSDEMIVEYLKAAAEDENPEIFLAALGDVARKGMTEVAKRTGLGRKSLYKALRPGSHPQYQTISSVLRAVGVKITFTKENA